MKKLLSIALALVMLLALAVPAMAADGVTYINNNHLGPYTDAKLEPLAEVHIFNALNPSGLDTSVDGDEFVLWHFVTTVGNGYDAVVTFGDNGIYTLQEYHPSGLPKNGMHFSIITPADWVLTEAYVKSDNAGNFNLSHVSYSPGEDGSISAVFQINKYINNFDIIGEGFEFDIYFIDENGNEVQVAKMTSDDNGKAEYELDPAEVGTYIIRERVDLTKYAPVDDLVVTVDEYGSVSYPEDNNFIINVSLGKLNVTDDVVEEYYNEYHKPVYKTFGTLVSWGNSLGGAEFPDGITGDYYLNNGMTYFKINKAALAALEDGATIYIAESNKSGGNKVSDKWNTPITVNGEMVSYNLKVVGDKLVIDCAIPNFGAAVYSSNTVKGPSDIKHNSVKEYTITTDKNGDFYFFFHIGGWVTDEVIGCAYDHTEGAFIREFTGEVDISIIVYKGDVKIYTGPLGLVEDLLAGDDYKVEIYVNGDLYDTINGVVVEAGQTTDVDFGNVIVNSGNPVIDVICNYCNPVTP